MSLDLLLDASCRQDQLCSKPDLSPARCSQTRQGTPMTGNQPITVSVERNTIKLEGKESPSDNHIQERVTLEIEQSSHFLEEGIPISVTCYVGGARCTKQHEMIDALLAKNPAWADLITPHLTCNFTPEDTSTYLAELQKKNITNLLAVSGDKLDPSFKTFTRHPDLREAPQLVALAHSFQDGKEPPKQQGNPAVQPSFGIAVAYSSFNGTNPSTEQRKMLRKAEAGAQSVKTQPVTYADGRLIERDHGFLSTLFPQPSIAWSVIYYQSLRMAQHIQSRYRIRVPDEVLRRIGLADYMSRRDPSPRTRVLCEGLHIAAQSIAYLVSSGAQSINVMGVKKPATFHKMMALVPIYLGGYARACAPRQIQREAMAVG